MLLLAETCIIAQLLASQLQENIDQSDGDIDIKGRTPITKEK